jgi:hypothetical protein
MDPALTLPERMYLLAYDLRKDKPADKAWLDFVVRVADLTRLISARVPGFDRLIRQMRLTRVSPTRPAARFTDSRG